MMAIGKLDVDDGWPVQDGAQLPEIRELREVREEDFRKEIKRGSITEIRNHIWITERSGINRKWRTLTVSTL